MVLTMFNGWKTMAKWPCKGVINNPSAMVISDITVAITIIYDHSESSLKGRFTFGH